MKRRRALRNTTLLIGSALSGSVLSGLWQSCTSKNSERQGILSRGQFDLLSQLCETIIPETDTPGAIEAGVPEFIELILTDVSTQEEVDNFKSGLQAFDENCASFTGQAFVACGGQEKEAYLLVIEEENGQLDEITRSFYQTLKHFTLLAYFSSEAGMSQALNYLPTPGGYEPCSDLDPNERITVGARL